MSYTLENGWILQAKHTPSPNFGSRPGGVEPELLVIHNISLPPGQFGGRCIEQFFTNCLDWQEHEYFAHLEGIKVSSHLLIRRTGELVQFVALQDRVWHAGKSCYQGREECNDFSIGIELEGTDCEPYADEQYATLAAVTVLLLRELPQMNAKAIVGHSDIAPGRKTDPGPAFDWQRYGSSI
jgi:AmpD protein